MKTYNKAFTLVELLVVISIITMMSSVVLVAVQGARDKGRVSGGLKFATYNYHAFGADATAQYDFNEASGDAKDLSGNARDLLQSASAFTRSGTGTVTGQGSYLSLTQNGPSGRTGDLPAVKQVAIPNSTISFWIYLTTFPGADNYIVSAFDNNNWAETLAVYWSSSDSRFHCYSELYGSNQDLSIAFTPTLGKWYHIACSANTGSSPKFTAYVDGKPVASLTPGVNAYMLTQKITSINVGSDDPSGYQGNDAGFTGRLDDFALYRSSLAASDIERIYAAGLPAHILARIR